MKKIILGLLTAALLVTGCQFFTQQTPEPTVTQTVVEPEIITPEPADMISFTEPVEVNALEIMQKKSSFYKARLEEYTPAEEADVQSYIANIADSTRLWKTGTFNNGTYAGQNLVVGDIGCDGPCPNFTVRFAVDETQDTWTLLTNYSYAVDNINEILFPIDAQDTEIVIPAFEIPAELDVYPTMKVLLADRASTTVMNFEGLQTETTDYTNDAFKKFFIFGGCLYGVMPDGVVARYAITPTEFIAEDGKGQTGLFLGNETVFSPAKELTFTDTEGVATTQEYSVEVGGCGIAATGCFPMEEPLGDEASKMVKIGTLGTLDAFMFTEGEEEPIEGSLMQLVKYRYDSYLMKYQYDETLQKQRELLFDEFIESKKIFFVKLGNGKYTLVSTPDLAPATECGKPVIYLYPTETTIVNVKVGVDKITKSIPAYGTNGWTVTASSDGTLVDSVDQQTYPYLFWEGQSAKKFSTETGWTLAKKEVATALPKVLQNMGLNEKETADFMEFWGPRIAAEKMPYIEFSFVAQKTFDQIAPLSITPTPETVLRVFMVYRGVLKQGLPVPSYTPVQRNGFTVIEWGGAL